MLEWLGLMNWRTFKMNLASEKVKIRIFKANTERAQYTWVNYLTLDLMSAVHDYLDELRQAAIWSKE